MNKLDLPGGCGTLARRWMLGVLLGAAAIASFPAAGAEGTSSPANTSSPRSNTGVPWPARDALGRALPLASEVGEPRAGRTVGVFYFLWHNNRGGKSPHWDAPYDISRILARDPNALKNPDSPWWGPIGMYHYWGEPLYGYYLSQDPWVLRRHAQLLADAGVDTLIFDTTNAETYPDVYRALCAVFRQVRLGGGKTPQFAFMVNTQAGATADKIYRDLYRPGLYRELWFQWQGKPLMICNPRRGVARSEVVLHAPARPLAVHPDEYPLRLALGGHLSTALWVHGRPRSTGTSQRVRGSEPETERRQGDQHERRERPRTQLPRGRSRYSAGGRQPWLQLPGAMATSIRTATPIRHGDGVERVDRGPVGASPANRWCSSTSSTRNSAATSNRSAAGTATTTTGSWSPTCGATKASQRCRRPRGLGVSG